MHKIRNYLISLIIMLAAVMVTGLAQSFVDQSSLVMVYILAVAITAFFLSLGPAIFISLCSVVIFDFFNLPPYMEFSRKPAEYLFTLAGMLITAAIISTLSARLRQKLAESRLRELRTSGLYALSVELAASRTNEEAIQITLRHLSSLFETTAELLGSQDLAQAPVVLPGRDDINFDSVSGKVFKYRDGEIVNTFIPVQVDGQFYGMVSLSTQGKLLADGEQTEHLQTMIRQMMLAIERNNLQHRIHQSELRVQHEQLRNTILNAISHDLRTPLATIIGASSSLVDTAGLSFEARQRLSMAVYEEAVHMQSMVENLLEMARIQSGDWQISRDWQAMEEIVGNALVSLRRRLQQHEISVDVPDNLPLIRCDSTLIERVIINLIENAGKYSPEGSVVHLSARTDGEFLALAVTDHGIGIAADEQDKVFEPFYRGNTNKTGFGLGLGICRSIILAHQGEISLQSLPGQGTTVTFKLPVPADSPRLELEH
jgi:two-component system sensor histidine kinase KdpD